MDFLLTNNNITLCRNVGLVFKKKMRSRGSKKRKKNEKPTTPTTKRIKTELHGVRKKKAPL